MLKDNNGKKIKRDNGNDGGMEALSKAFSDFSRDIGERLDYIESKKDASQQARLEIIQRLYNTDNEHLPELTRISLRMVDPLSLADTAAAILSPAVQSGEITLGQIRRVSMYRHLRSVKGDFIEKAAQISLEQVRTSEEEAAGDEAALGKGL